MQMAIDQLKAERDALVAYVQAHKALTFPVRRLPLDLLQEIFMACLPAHRNCVMSARESPVLLGRICSSWRAISLSTPRLWARINIVEPPQPFPLKLAKLLETTKTWLGRSGQCPLSISLQGGPSENVSRQFIQALFPFAPRWQHIQCTLLPLAFQSLTHLAAADVPMLESLTLHLHSALANGRIFDHRLFGLLRGPRISSFGITGCKFTLPDLLLQWDRLTNLSILRPSVIGIISLCPELRRCRLMLENATAGTPSPCGILEHRSLQVFELSSESALSAFNLLLRLALPDIRDFTLTVADSPFAMSHTLYLEAENGIPALTGFLAASTRLTSFSLAHDSFSKRCMVDIVRSLPPTMQRLTIQNPRHDGWGVPDALSSLDDDVLALLSPPPAGTACCPALQQLYLPNALAISDRTLLRLVMSRADGPCSALQKLWVSFSREMQDDVRPELQAYIDNGLKIYISHLPSRHQLNMFPLPEEWGSYSLF
ncbi:hypothetical protein DFH09DRAFT_1397458 [Mycena vulgaris]|nr:hypothetical protein DFH09DRAFT_1397458 [Mycena vulgaris]